MMNMYFIVITFELSKNCVNPEIIWQIISIKSQCASIQLQCDSIEP